MSATCASAKLEAALFLASEDPAFMTGSELVIDGGILQL
jgi:NAD(P)-dependent dehydrogenase (short-subunit alcohol dehydrogenase family)